MQSPLRPITRRTLLARLPQGITLILVLLASSCATTSPESAAQGSRKSAKILTIGNSFSYDAVILLPQLAESGGKEITIFRANMGGCSLERHARHLKAAITNPDSKEARPYKNNRNLNLPGQENVSLIEALSAQKWDFVTIQQVSSLSFKPESYEPHAAEIIAAIRQYAPTAEILVHKTWAYREDHAMFQNNDGFTQQTMYEGLSKAYDLLSRQYNLRMIRSGDAMQEARKLPRWTYRKDPGYDFENPPEWKLPDQHGSLNVGYAWRMKDGTPELYLDAIHANVHGRYLTACVFYEAIYNDSALHLSFFPKEISDEDARLLRQIAHSVGDLSAPSPR